MRRADRKLQRRWYCQCFLRRDYQPEDARRWISKARMCLLTNPGVYIIRRLGIAGDTAQCAEQIGDSIADVVASALFRAMISQTLHVV